jgi:DNA-binding NtrC family response regulator
VTDEAFGRLRAYAWPGNVRELGHMIQRAVVLEGGGMIGTRYLEFREGGAGESIDPLARAFCGAGGPDLWARWTARWEAPMIRAALEASGGNLTAAAKLLGISRVTLRAKIKEYGLRG